MDTNDKVTFVKGVDPKSKTTSNKEDNTKFAESLLKEAENFTKEHSVREEDSMSASMIDSPYYLKRINKIKEANPNFTYYATKGLEGINKDYYKAEYELKKQRAEDQGGWGELGAALVQTFDEITAGTLEGAGYIFDLGAWEDLFNGSKTINDNWLSSIMREHKEQTRELFPIYMNPDDEGKFAPWNSEWWASNAPSIASSLSILIPVFGASRLVSMAGKGVSFLGKRAALEAAKQGFKGARVLNNISDPIKALAKVSPTGASLLKHTSAGITNAFLSRQIESNMEAFQVYDEKYKEYKEAGLSDEAAKKAASEGASYTYRENWNLFWADLPQFIIGSYMGYSPKKFITSFKLAKLEGQSIGKTLMLKGGTAGYNMVSEGAEEILQFMYSEEGKYLSDRKAYPEQYKDKPKRDDSIAAMWGRNYNKGEMWTAGFFGAIGGVAMNPMMRGLSKVSNKILGKTESQMSETQARIEEATNRVSNMFTFIQQMQTASQQGNEQGVKIARSNMAIDAGIRAANTGNLTGMLRTLKNIKESSPEELNKLSDVDLNDENFQDFLNNIDDFADKVNEIATAHAKNRQSLAHVKYGEAFAEILTKNQYLKEHFQERAKELDPLIVQAENAIRGGIVSTNELFNLLYEAKKTILLNKRNIEQSKFYRVNIKDPLELEAFDKEIEAKEALIKEQEDTIKKHSTLFLGKDKIMSGLLSKEEELVLTKLDSQEGTEFAKLVSEKDANIRHLTSIEKEISNIEKVKRGGLTDEEYLKIKEEEAKLRNKGSQETTEKEEPEEDPTDDTGFIEEETFENITLETLKNKDHKEQILELIDKGELNIEDAIIDEEAREELKKELIKREAIRKGNPIVEESLEEEIETDEASNGVVTQTFNNDFEIVDNEVATEDFEEPLRFYTSELTPLAWLSPFNEEFNLEEATPENKALSDLIERDDTFPNNYSVRFDINKEEASKLHELYPEYISKEGNLIKYPDNDDILGIIPIKASLYHKGKPYTISINGKDTHLSMSLHVLSFFKAPSVAEAQMAINLDHRRNILDLLAKGEVPTSELEGVTDGALNVKKDDNNKFVKNSLEEVFGDLTKIKLVYGHKDYKYYELNEKSDILRDLNSATPGAIYAVVRRRNGDYMPIRLFASKLNNSEASLIHLILKQYIGKTEKETIDNSLIPQEIKDFITDSKDPRISGLTKYFLKETTTLENLLDHLVYKVKASSKKSGSVLQLYTNPNTKKIELKISIGKTEGKFTSVKGLEIQKEKITESLVANRNRQIDVSLLNNKEYIKYLNDNKLLTSTVAKQLEEPMFIQNVVNYGEIESLKPETQKEQGLKVETSLSESAIRLLEELGFTEEIRDKMTTEDLAEAKTFKSKEDAKDLLNKYGVKETPKVKKEITTQTTTSKESLQVEEVSISVQGVLSKIEEIQLNHTFIKLTDDKKFYENSKTKKKYKRVTNFISDIPIDFIEKLPSESLSEFEKRLTKAGHSKAKIASSKVTAIALEIGTKIDTLFRDFFNKELKDPSEYDFTSEDNVKDTIKALSLIEREMLKRGETSVEGKIILYNDELGIAGEVDLLTVDKEGNVRLYDFKTMRGDKLEENNFGQTTYDSTSVFELTGELKPNGEPKYKIVPNKKQDSSRVKHQKQLSLYNILLFKTYGIKAKALGVIPVKVSYTIDEVYTNTMKILKGIPFKPLASVNNIGINQIEIIDSTENTKEQEVLFTDDNISKNNNDPNTTNELPIEESSGLSVDFFGLEDGFDIGALAAKQKKQAEQSSKKSTPVSRIAALQRVKNLIDIAKKTHPDLLSTLEEENAFKDWYLNKSNMVNDTTSSAEEVLQNYRKCFK